jgi:hypothetical protein
MSKSNAQHQASHMMQLLAQAPALHGLVWTRQKKKHLAEFRLLVDFIDLF